VTIRISCISLVLLTAFTDTVFAETPTERLQSRSISAGETLSELITSPNRNVPTSLLKSATCVAVIPKVVNGGVLAGGTSGRGVASCRDGNDWSAPEFLILSGGSIGFQIGIDSIDLVLIFVRTSAIDVVSQDFFTLGVNASISAGPIGKDLRAGEDYKLDSDIYSYSRARGLFAGVAFQGTVIKPDASADQLLYGPNLTSKEILAKSGASSPIETLAFIETLKMNFPKQ